MVTGTYAFEHLLTREAAYSALLESNRRALHSIVAGELAAALASGAAAEWEVLGPLALHLEAAGKLAEAHRYYCAQLRLMAETGRYSGWAAAWAAAERCPAGGGPSYLQRWAEAAREYAEGRFGAARPLFEQALAQAQAASDFAAAGALLMALGACRMRLGELDAAEGLFHEALARHEASADLEQQCQVWRSLAILRRDRGDDSGAAQSSRRALGLAQRCPGPRLEAQVRIALGNEAKMYRTFAEGEEQQRRGLELARRAGDIETMGACLAGVAEVHLAQGRFELAGPEAREALELARATGNPRSLSFALNVLAGLQTCTGQAGAARQTLAESIGVSAASQYPWGRLLALQYRQRLERACGDYGAAAACALEVSQLAARLGHPLLAANALAGAAEGDILTGALDAAQEKLFGGGRPWLALGAYWVCLPLCLCARLAAAQGDAAGAQAALAEALRRCAEFAPWPDSPQLAELQRTAELVGAAR